MDFVDKVTEGAREIADSVVKTTGDLVEKGKKSLELSKLKGDQRDTLTALGEVTYGIEKGYGSEGAKADLVAKLDDIAQKINDIESARETERQQREDSREAERARREVQRAQRAAETGGPAAMEASDTADAEEAPDKGTKCPECGQGLVEGMAYCGYCGAKIKAE